MTLLARNALVERIVALLPRCLSVRLSGTDVHCDHTVHFSAGFSLRFDCQCSGHPDTKACPPTPSRPFPVPPKRWVGYGMDECKRKRKRKH